MIYNVSAEHKKEEIEEEVFLSNLVDSEISEEDIRK